MHPARLPRCAAFTPPLQPDQSARGMESFRKVCFSLGMGEMMKAWGLVFSSWVVTALIAVLGVNAGATIWYYQEPVIDAVPEPASYFLAAYSGIAVLSLSFIVSVAVTVHVGRCANIAPAGVR
jgi:hypothetical protein